MRRKLILEITNRQRVNKVNEYFERNIAVYYIIKLIITVK